MARIVFLRHGEAEKNATVPNAEQQLTPLGCKQAYDVRIALARVHFSPDLVIVSDAVRTAQTAYLVAGDSVLTLKVPELRNMGRAEHAAVTAIMQALGEGVPFRTLLRANVQGTWMRHAEATAQKLRDLVAERNAHQVLIVGHHYTQNSIGIALTGREDELLMGPFFGHAEGFLLDTQGNVTAITRNSP